MVSGSAKLTCKSCRTTTCDTRKSSSESRSYPRILERRRFKHLSCKASRAKRAHSKRGRRARFAARCEQHRAGHSRRAAPMHVASDFRRCSRRRKQHALRSRAACGAPQSVCINLDSRSTVSATRQNGSSAARCPFLPLMRGKRQTVVTTPTTRGDGSPGSDRVHMQMAMRSTCRLCSQAMASGTTPGKWRQQAVSACAITLSE
jgi:hypothetical protein